jgi:DNA invertase Pin-like site-specific DNA recombinase
MEAAMENTSETKRVALYARVSTLKKNENGDFLQDPENQLMVLREHCKRMGWEKDGEYVDRASGAKESRPQLNRLMQDITTGKFNAVCVWKFDRFARSARHLLNTLKIFEDNGIAFISVTENADTSTGMGKLVFTMLGAVAEMERTLIVERTNAGIRKAKACGTRSGRAIGAPRNTLTTAEVKARIAAGETVAQIADSLNISRALVYKRMHEKEKS